jgi:hypothetical protein
MKRYSDKISRKKTLSLFDTNTFVEEKEPKKYSDAVPKEKLAFGEISKEQAYKRAELEGAKERIGEAKQRERLRKISAQERGIEAETRLAEAKLESHQKEMDSKLALAEKKEHIRELKKEYFRKAHPLIAKLEESGQEILASKFHKKYDRSFQRHSERIGVKHVPIKRYHRRLSKKYTAKQWKRMMMLHPHKRYMRRKKSRYEYHLGGRI